MKQTYRTSLVDSGCCSGLYNSHDLSCFFHSSLCSSPLLHEPTRLWRLVFPCFSCSSKLLFSYSSIFTLSRYRVTKEECSRSVAVQFTLNGINICGNNFSEFRQLDHLQSSVDTMCVAFSFSGSYIVLFDIYSICNVIHKPSCGISYSPIPTKFQNTKSCLLKHSLLLSAYDSRYQFILQNLNMNKHKTTVSKSVSTVKSQLNKRKIKHILL